MREGQLAGSTATTHVLLASELCTDKWESQSGKVTSAAGTADHNVGVVVREFHLPHGFLSNHRLMKEHMVQHAAKRIFGVIALGRDFNGFADGDPETSGVVRILSRILRPDSVRLLGLA